jgi:hypothetical protein
VKSCGPSSTDDSSFHLKSIKAQSKTEGYAVSQSEGYRLCNSKSEQQSCFIVIKFAKCNELLIICHFR